MGNLFGKSQEEREIEEIHQCLKGVTAFYLFFWNLYVIIQADKVSLVPNQIFLAFFLLPVAWDGFNFLLYYVTIFMSWLLPTLYYINEPKKN